MSAERQIKSSFRMASHSTRSEQAYVVLTDGVRWRDVYRLVQGHTLAIGRESTNQVSLDDHRCSRRHCELDYESGWVVRDLGSSNGTQINGEKIRGTVALNDRDVIRVGESELLFTYDITRQLTPHSDDSADHSTVEGLLDATDLPMNGEDDPEILEKKGRSAYLDRDAGPDIRYGFAGLYRLVAAMVEAQDVVSLAETVLDGLFEVLSTDIGAVLLLPDTSESGGSADDLRLMAYRAPENLPYHRVSDRLSNAAMQSGDGMLALDVAKDDAGSEFRTLEQMNARSVICVPIRSEDRTCGLIHLYSLSTENSMDADDLEFALAVAEHMAGIVVRLNENAQLSAVLESATVENRSLRQMLCIESDLIGESTPMRLLRDEIARFAVTDSTALIRGESGVGKELVARAIHFNSPRKDGPFVCLNCAALSESLLESELFGHEKGSFTGATGQKPGKFEQADNGTLMLDEVGEMSPQIQAKFLRALEGHSFERVGGHTAIHTNVRVVAATNRDLEQAVRDGEFRNDLFFRLNILEIMVPPLRDRRDDIPGLANHFLQISATRQGMALKSFTAETLAALRAHDWPGNVRELRNIVERALALSRGPEITLQDVRFPRLTGDSPTSADDGVYKPLSVKEIEKRHIAATLEFTGWVKRETARILGIERSTLDRKMKAYGIERPDEK